MDSQAEPSLLERLRRQTTCPKCGKRYLQPKLLPCNHSVCHSCLDLQQGFRKGLDYIVICPSCHTETELPKSGRDSLPAAFFKQHLSETCTRLEKAEEGKGCEECSNSDASLASFCADCQLFICSDCHATHKRLKSLSGHRLLSMEQFYQDLRATLSTDGPSSSLPLSPAGPMVCPAHKEALKLYCRTCQSLICRDCTLHDHEAPRHKHDFVSNLVAKQKSDLEGSLAAIRGLLTEVRGAVSEMAGVQHNLTEQKTALCSIIDDSFRDLQDRLERTRKKLLRAAEKKAETKAETLSKEIAALENKASELDSLVQTCDEALLHTTDQEFMMLRRDLQTRVKEATIRKQHYSPVPLAELPDMFLPSSCSEEIMSTCREHAHNCLTVSRSKSGLMKTGPVVAEVGKTVSFTVSSVTRNKTPCIERVEVKVTVSVPRSEITTPSQVTPGLQLGTYVISFVPTVKGEHVVSIHLGGKEIERSPMIVAVRSSEPELDLPTMVLTQQEWPWGVACSASREVYVTENYNHQVSVWDKEGKHLRTFGQKGQKPGQLLSPTGIAVDKNSHVYVADGRENGRVQKFSNTGQLLAIYVGLQDPYGIALNPKEQLLFVCDNSNQRIVVLDTALRYVSTFGEQSCSLEFEYHEVMVMGGLESPHSIAMDTSGNIYITDTSSSCIHVYSEEGVHLRPIKHPHDDMFAPSGIAIEDQFIYVADRGGNQVVVFNISGEFVTCTGSHGKGKGQFHNPTGVALDADGFLYVCDYGNNRLQIF